MKNRLTFVLFAGVGTAIGIIGGCSQQVVGKSAGTMDGDPTILGAGWFRPGYWTLLEQTRTINSPELFRAVGPGHQHFHAIVSPHHPGSVAATFANTQLATGNKAISLTDGFAYITGGWPIVFTERLIASGYGTSMVVEIDRTATGEPIHRVYLLKPDADDRIEVSVLGSAPAVVWLQDAECAVEIKETAPGTFVAGPIIPKASYTAPMLATLQRVKVQIDQFAFQP